MRVLFTASFFSYESMAHGTANGALRDLCFRFNAFFLSALGHREQERRNVFSARARAHTTHRFLHQSLSVSVWFQRFPLFFGGSEKSLCSFLFRIFFHPVSIRRLINIIFRNINRATTVRRRPAGAGHTFFERHCNGQISSKIRTQWKLIFISLIN